MAKKSKKKNKAPIVILTNEQNPALPAIIQALYTAFAEGQMALVMGMDSDTGVVSPMLAGLDMVDGVIENVHPVAKLLSDPAELERILIPDGQGNYVSNTTGFYPRNTDGEASTESRPTIQ